MRWIELHYFVQCPHCGSDQQESAEFNMGEADNCGVSSPVHSTDCTTCEEGFYFKLHCSFELDFDSFKTEPKK